LPIPKREIAAFCKRWKVVELSLFGSAVRSDFSPDSDIDTLISFSSQSEWSLFDHIQMKQELKELFGHDVDLITQRVLEQSHNELLRAEILKGIQVVYATTD
jgi:hypothetical protein